MSHSTATRLELLQLKRVVNVVDKLKKVTDVTNVSLGCMYSAAMILWMKRERKSFEDARSMGCQIPIPPKLQKGKKKSHPLARSQHRNHWQQEKQEGPNCKALRQQLQRQKKAQLRQKRKPVPLSAAGINNEENIKKQRIIKQIELYDETIISSGEGGESDESEESDWWM